MEWFTKDRYLLDKLKLPEYNFFDDNKQLGNQMILVALSGSRAYGTSLETSDTDLRGVTIERKDVLFGLKSFEQFEDRTTDTVIYGLKKFVNLCIQANPNVLELLGVRPEELIYITDIGRYLQKHAGLFLSKRAIQSFGSYAAAQLRRLENALARDSYPQTEQEKHILCGLQNQMEHFQRTYGNLYGDEIRLFIDETDKEDMKTEIFMDINMKHYSLRDFKNIYSEMSNLINSYSKLNHRNRKKDDAHLNKHAMHLIRLLMTGRDILDGKGIRTYRESERALLFDIRMGKYSFDKIFDMVDRFEEEFQTAAGGTQLPDRPDEGQIQKLTMEIYERFYG